MFLQLSFFLDSSSLKKAANELFCIFDIPYERMIYKKKEKTKKKYYYYYVTSSMQTKKIIARYIASNYRKVFRRYRSCISSVSWACDT